MSVTTTADRLHEPGSQDLDRLVPTDAVRDTTRRVRGVIDGAKRAAGIAGQLAERRSPRKAITYLRDIIAPTPHPLSSPPAGSGLRPVMGDSDEPILGSARYAAGDRLAWAQDKHQRYGNLWWGMLAGRRFVFVSGGDASKQVLINADKEFSSDGWVELIGKFFGGGLMLMSFGEHLDHRRIMHSAFTPQRLNGYLAGMDEQIRGDLARDHWDDGQHLLYPQLKDLGLRIATDVFLGMELDQERRTTVLASFHAQARAPLAKLRVDLPGTLWGRGRSGYDHVQAFFWEHLDTKRETPGTDLFSAMAVAEDDGGTRFTDEEVVKHMNFLWFAAHDTTNLAMTMMAWAFAAHPEWQDRARQEVLALGLAEDEPLTRDHLGQLESIDVVMKECMRLWPPVPANMRKSVVDTQIDGYYIPKGTWLNVHQPETHRMPEYWERPDEFDPSRFLAPREEHKAHSHAYLPFGGGVHKCIGFAFAEMEAKAVYARLLLTHELSVPAGYEPKMVWLGLPEPGDKLPVTVTRRR
ncbi:MAG: cytochrome P450 [Myxococcota bacterium]